MRIRRYGDALGLKQARPSGRKKNSLYPIYMSMKDRCYNPNNTFFKDYGGRGLKVCHRWLGISGFDNFLLDMGERPDGYTLDRIDNNSGYSPDNCRWATRKLQAENRRSNRPITLNGVTKNLKQWTEEYGLNYKLAHQRIFRDGWSVEQTFGVVL